MTTIAASRKEMAADSQVTAGSAQYHTDKIFTIRDSLVGVAGTVEHTTQFLSWFRRECPADALPMDIGEDESFCALVLNPRGLFYYSNTVEPDRIHEPFFAIGSGSDYAVAAMHLGKSPADAVKVASKYDPSTGGAIKVLKVHAPRKTRSKRAVPTSEAQGDQSSEAKS